MSAFADAIADIVADPNLGQAAVYWQTGMNVPADVRVVVSSVDKVDDFTRAGFVDADVALLCSRAAVPTPVAGDVFVVGTVLYEVLAPLADSLAGGWRLSCRKLAEGTAAHHRLRVAST